MNMKVGRDGVSGAGDLDSPEKNKVDPLKSLPDSSKESAGKVKGIKKLFASITNHNSDTNVTRHTGSTALPKKENKSLWARLSSLSPKIFVSQTKKTTSFQEQMQQGLAAVREKNAQKSANPTIHLPPKTTQQDASLPAVNSESTSPNEAKPLANPEPVLPKGIRPTAKQLERYQESKRIASESMPLPVSEPPTSLDRAANVMDKIVKQRLENTKELRDHRLYLEKQSSDRRNVLDEKKAALEERKLKMAEQIQEYRQTAASMSVDRLASEKTRLSNIKSAREATINLAKADIEKLSDVNKGALLHIKTAETREKYEFQIAEQQAQIDNYDQMLTILAEESDRRKA